MDNLYVLVDFNSSIIISLIDNLPSDWSNINGLNLMDYSKIKDLEWSGNKGFGWIKLNDEELKNYTYTDDWIGLSKLKLKELIANERRKKENEILSYNGKEIKVDDKTKIALSNKLSISNDEIEPVIWKFFNGFIEVSILELKEIQLFIDSYIQECFNKEHECSLLIDSTTDLDDILNLDLNISWPQTTN